ADQLLGYRHGQLLAGLALPDDEAAARIVARPAGVALAVLFDVVPADRARAEVCARDADVLQFLVELFDGDLREACDVAHELRARVLAALDLVEPVLPLASHVRRGERVLAEQPDHVEALVGGHQGARLAFDVADLDQALDDRGARRGRADAGVLHRLARLLVVDELAGGLHRTQQGRVAVAAWRLGFLALACDLERLYLLALLQLGQLLVG